MVTVVDWLLEMVIIFSGIQKRFIYFFIFRIFPRYYLLREEILTLTKINLI